MPHSEAKEERPSFFEKKEAKKLLIWRPRNDAGHGLDLGTGGDIKVFCFFSSEKKGFSYFDTLLPRESPHPGHPHKGEGDAGRVAFFQERRILLF